MIDDAVSRIVAELPAVPHASTDREAVSDALDQKATQATQLVRLAERSYRFGQSDDGVPFAVAVAGPSVVRPLRGRHSLRAELASIYFEEFRRAASAASLTDALAVIEGRAMRAPREEVALRVGVSGDSVTLDLATESGDAVVIRPDGWSVVQSSPILFRRSALTAALPTPRRGGSIDMLRPFLNVDEATFRLVIAWLVAVLKPQIPRPILLLVGQQGTAKSSTARFLGRLLDPSPAPLWAAPRDVEAWALAAAGSTIVTIDNLSTVQPWLSDSLCRAVTGDGLVRRQNYTDRDLVVTSFRRCVVLTTIDAGAFRGDLAERILSIELQPIEPMARRREAELDDKFSTIHDLVLGAILDLASDVSGCSPEVAGVDLPRMADFAAQLAALDELLGWQTLATYADQAHRLNRDVIEGDSFAQAVIGFVESVGVWQGTATDLLQKLREPRHASDWPRSGAALGGKLRRLAPALRSVGVELGSSRSPGGSRTRLLRLSLSDTDLRHRLQSSSGASEDLVAGDAGDGRDDPRPEQSGSIS